MYLADKKVGLFQRHIYTLLYNESPPPPHTHTHTPVIGTYRGDAISMIRLLQGHLWGFVSRNYVVSDQTSSLWMYPLLMKELTYELTPDSTVSDHRQYRITLKVITHFSHKWSKYFLPLYYSHQVRPMAKCRVKNSIEICGWETNQSCWKAWPLFSGACILPVARYPQNRFRLFKLFYH